MEDLKKWSPEMEQASDRIYESVVASAASVESPNDRVRVIVDVVERLKGVIESLTGYEAHDKPIQDLKRIRVCSSCFEPWKDEPGWQCKCYRHSIRLVDARIPERCICGRPIRPGKLCCCCTSNRDCDENDEM